MGMDHLCPPVHPALEEAKTRLKKIEGQIRGISRMIDDNKYCIDIVNQISAARAALNTTAMVILRKHLETCVSQAILEGGGRRDAIIEEMMDLLKKQDI
jgi:DNA-binding FrmR family transcriptional regulator